MRKGKNVLGKYFVQQTQEPKHGNIDGSLFGKNTPKHVN